MKSFGSLKISQRGLIQSTLSRFQSTTATTTSSSSSAPEIQIPVRKQRAPSDLLKALEKTISRDPTAPKYKYHDDPYLIPYSNMQKRTFALAQESGRKTAMWIRQEHANLFQHRVADPVIENFLPKAVYTSKDLVSEEILKNVIKDGHKSDALTIYQLLEENVSDETKQSLLELLCYYNVDTRFNEELLEQKWFRKSNEDTMWQDCRDTDKIFASLKEKEGDAAARAYNAMICGLAKHMRVQQAWEVYKEAESKSLPISLDTYNRLITTIPLMKDGTRERCALLVEMLAKIQQDNIQANVRTLNAALKLAMATVKHAPAMEICRDIFTEFKAVGVEPSLGSFYYALIVFYKKSDSTTPPSSLLREIIDELEQRDELKVEDPIDVHFFPVAMDIAANFLQDPILADRIHTLLLKDKNYKLIGDGFKENLYYRHFCQVQIKNNSLDEFVSSYYDLLVPHMYTPEPAVFNDLLQAVSANDPEMGVQLLPRFWSHLVQFGYLERRDLVAMALNLMRKHCVPPKDSDVHKMYADAAWTVWDFVMTQRTKRVQQINFTGPILGDVAVLCLRGKEFDKWTKIISFMYNEQNTILGPPTSEQIQELFDACLMGGHAQSAMELIHYCSNIGAEDISTMAYKLYRNVPLLDHQLARLKTLVDPEVLKVGEKDSGEK